MSQRIKFGRSQNQSFNFQSFLYYCLTPSENANKDLKGEINRPLG